ncbi:carboxypeptidase-like regulatory domain-containing protein [Flavivirga spongiicola]|uniref:Carboxypeptidase-like regulatory domain-containing protein n=1 Tax=Flavivirga spongiicola TaxID=421621 RepID=A0ABU7XVV4_9FLAO|nr:carboxypeptidase-like regulatory domain-containing protein [Flavivirga sp. MEBiC05379]MDO5979915.1 carboxypeptidase-like regulatory domain-containing protein [Flavivirga sp. MEBiC05379]
MKQTLTSSIFIFLSLYLSGQSINRIEMKGVLLSATNDVEAVTIFNTSSNKGTITNEKGEFVIKVALRDVIEISALQFQTVSITVDADVIKTKQLKIQLVEQINQLDAVTLSSGLTGNILADVGDVKTVEPIRVDMGNINRAFEYNDVKAFDNEAIGNHLKAIINPEARNYLPDAVKILESIFKTNLSIKMNLSKRGVEEKPKDLLDVYSYKHIGRTFDMSPEHLSAFVAFVEEKGIDPEFYKRENEIQLIAFLIKQKELFLKLQNAKN